MDDKYSNFDEKKLFTLKDNFSGYRFCPRCGTDLEQRMTDGLMRMVCPNVLCGFIFYQNPVPAAGAIVVQDDSILLVKRAHPPKIDWWCIPAGFMEWSEHPSQTAVRELKEETGLDVEIESFFEVYSGNDDCRNNAVLMLYLADVVGGELDPGDDASEVAYFPFDNIPDRIAFEAHIQALADYNSRIRGNR